MRANRVFAWIADSRYTNDRIMDVTEWPVADLERLQHVWHNEVEVFTKTLTGPAVGDIVSIP